MKLNEVFAKRKTYGYPRSRPIQNPTLQKALEAFRQVANTQEIWDELQESIKHDRKMFYSGRGNWNQEQAMRTTYANAISLLTRDLEKELRNL